MTILITGGTGFVGKNLAGDVKASSRDADLREFTDTLSLIKSVNPSTIIHAAAKHGNFSQIEKDKVGYYRDNVLMNFNVFEAARLSGVKNLIAFSSVTAFPDGLEMFSEVDLYSGEPHLSCYPYGYAKRTTDVLCRAYTEQYDLNYNCIFLANAYGPHGKDNVIPALIQKCREAQLNSTAFEVLGDGSPKRDFIFIQDVRDIVEQLIHVQKFGSVIISSGTSVYIRDVVEEIVRAVKFGGKVNWKADEFIGQESKIPSNQKLRNLLPNLKFTPFRQGIEETVDWFKKNKA